MNTVPPKKKCSKHQDQMMWSGVSLCVWFAFPKWLIMLSIFTLYIFFGEMFIQILIFGLFLKFSFLLLGYGSSLFLLNTGPTTHTRFADISASSWVVCFLMVSLKHRSFKFSWSPVYFFLSLLELLVSYLRNHCQIQSHKDSLLCFLLRILQF